MSPAGVGGTPPPHLGWWVNWRAGRAGRVEMLVREPGHKHQHLPELCRGELSANGNSLTRFGAALNIF